MPNSKCEKCNLYLDDIIKTKEDKIKFCTLIHTRLKKICGIGYGIDPYIKHNELIPNHKCTGNMNYEPFHANPKNFNEFNFNDLLFNFDLDKIIKKIESL